MKKGDRVTASKDIGLVRDSMTIYEGRRGVVMEATSQTVKVKFKGRNYGIWVSLSEVQSENEDPLKNTEQNRFEKFCLDFCHIYDCGESELQLMEIMKQNIDRYKDEDLKRTIAIDVYQELLNLMTTDQGGYLQRRK